MKKIILAAAAAASLLGAGAVATSASAMPGHGGHGPVVGGGFRGGFRGPGFRGGFRGGPIYRGEYRGYRGGWIRGGFWPHGYGVVIVDPVVYGLYAAPYGYQWMQAEDGSMVLVAVGTGLIADVVVR